MIPNKHIFSVEDWWKEYERALWAKYELVHHRDLWSKHIFWLRCIRHRLIGYKRSWIDRVREGIT